MYRLARIAAIVGLTVSTLVLSSISFSGAKNAELLNEEHAQTRVRAYGREADAEIKQQCSILPTALQADCRQSIYDRVREEQRRELEVEAQRNSAVWNEAMGEAALMGAMFSVATLIL